ncbi:hypothetical protein BJY01DRAFT_227594 [Aspergillus pseudoustus]|uniref:Secreted protein n=1 Tax=Aspergillus pseudoustus TaxID=1810923 RepID=A0ABR4IQ80_9EURO
MILFFLLLFQETTRGHARSHPLHRIHRFSRSSLLSDSILLHAIRNPSLPLHPHFRQSLALEPSPALVTWIVKRTNASTRETTKEVTRGRSNPAEWQGFAQPAKKTSGREGTTKSSGGDLPRL